ncbi:hypothetical protein HK100_000238, partial [Physocladia obscura]
NFYAAKQAIEINAKDNDSQLFLLNLLDILEAVGYFIRDDRFKVKSNIQTHEMEQEKAKFGQNEAITNDVVGYAHVENFALKIFLSADTEDVRVAFLFIVMPSFQQSKYITLLNQYSGPEKQRTSTFLEVLRVFGSTDETVNEKIRYGRFKAVDILKALKEGKQPTPGPPGGEPPVAPDLSNNEPSYNSNSLSQPSAPNFPDFSPPGHFDPLSINQIGQPLTFDPLFHTSAPPNESAASPNQQLPFFDALSQLAAFPTIPSGTLDIVGVSNSVIAQIPSNPDVKVAVPPPTAPAPQSFHQPPPQQPYQPPPPQTFQQPIQPVQSNYQSSSSNYAQQQQQQPKQLSRPVPIDHTVITAATKNCKFAISALQYDDVNTAIDNLEKALAILRPHRK